MTKKVSGRVYRDDEEPERAESWDTSPYYDAIRGLCEFCGRKGHNKKKCPDRPLSDLP